MTWKSVSLHAGKSLFPDQVSLFTVEYSTLYQLVTYFYNYTKAAHYTAHTH